MSSGKRPIIVFTNGVFDLVHVGHIHLFKEAKKLGDKLVVGLNSDESAARIKRETINSEKKRKELLRAIRYVDEVEIFYELNPLSLIKKIRPDILVKGGDYVRETVVGHEFVESYGGKVILISTLNGNSTSELIKRIKGCSSEKNSSK